MRKISLGKINLYNRAYGGKQDYRVTAFAGET